MRSGFKTIITVNLESITIVYEVIRAKFHADIEPQIYLQTN